jgi:hypothetical protein
MLQRARACALVASRAGQAERAVLQFKGNGHGYVPHDVCDVSQRIDSRSCAPRGPDTLIEHTPP